ncbi:MAG: cytochrome c oxidase subunit 3 [Verrucomicrobiota bacterium]
MEIPYIVTPRKDTGLFNSKIGIWLFLASEVMLFGGFFSAYVFLRIGADYPWPERTLPILPGLINTFILILSSVTVVFAWAALKMRNWRGFQIYMGITIICAAVFMGFKAVEYAVKFKHAAVRMADYSVVEGHLGYEKEGKDYVKDVDGEKIKENHYRIAAKSLTFDLTRAYKPWVRSFLAEAEAVGTSFKLAEGVDFNAPGETDESKVFEEGAELSLDLLGDLASVHIANRNDNAQFRTRFLEEAWDQKWAEVKATDGLGQGAFAADYPKGLELGPKERKVAYAKWKAGKRARLAEEVDLTAVTLKIDGAQKSYSDVMLPEKPKLEFVSAEPVTLRFKGHDLISKYAPGGEQATLRDGTNVGGKYLESPMTFHEADGIDFQHVAMIAEEKGQEPLAAIENTWLIKENPEVAGLWKKHQKAVGQLEELLNEDGKEPTHKERYRMGWQEIAYYMQTDYDDVAIDPKKRTVPKAEMTLAENFKGPNYDNRKGQFPEIKIPREEVMLSSMFTPKWNNYYAIYFTITGLHGLHVIGGAIVLGYYLFFGRKMYLSNPEWLANRVEVGGLFWHFVDLVWIFAFPIFYLM